MLLRIPKQYFKQQTFSSVILYEKIKMLEKRVDNLEQKMIDYQRYYENQYLCLIETQQNNQDKKTI